MHRIFFRKCLVQVVLLHMMGVALLHWTVWIHIMLNALAQMKCYHCGRLVRMYIFRDFFYGAAFPRGPGPHYRGFTLTLRHTALGRTPLDDITQNTYIQSWTVTEITAIEKWGLLWCPRTVSCQLTVQMNARPSVRYRITYSTAYHQADKAVHFAAECAVSYLTSERDMQCHV
jgi:hypothetical protein